MPGKKSQSKERVEPICEAVPPRADDPERRTWTVEQAGQILGISRITAYSYARSGEIPTIRLGRRLLVPKAALEKLLAGV